MSGKGRWGEGKGNTWHWAARLSWKDLTRFVLAGLQSTTLSLAVIAQGQGVAASDVMDAHQRHKGVMEEVGALPRWLAWMACMDGWHGGWQAWMAY